jgi:DNA-binding SARP family transcriptional activator
VLAVLLLDLNQPVSGDRLIDRIWGEDPPASGRNALYSCMAKLKSALAEAGDPSVGLYRWAGGYVLAADAGQVDLQVFRGLVSAVQATDSDDKAAELLDRALALWQGETWLG